MRLVESRAVAVAGVNPILTLSDYKCVAGQNLFATLELRNQTDTAIPIKSVLWTGQGTSSSAVNTLKEVNVPPIPALRNLKRGYKTLLPNDLVPGSYTLTVTAEMNEGKQTQSSITFAVVEPIQVQMGSEPQPVVIIGQTKLGILVDIQSAVPRGWRGNVELTNFPQGWELEGGRKRTVEIEREDGKKVVRFGFKLPSTTPAGDYPVEGIVTWRGREWKLRTVVQVERTEVTPAPKKP
jgi:molybdopterin-binding protein